MIQLQPNSNRPVYLLAFSGAFCRAVAIVPRCRATFDIAVGIHEWLLCLMDRSLMLIATGGRLSTHTSQSIFWEAVVR